MGKEKMKQLLAGLGIASLVAAAGVTVPGPVSGASGWGGSSGAGSAKEKAQSGWGGSTGAGSAEKKDTSAEKGTAEKQADTKKAKKKTQKKKDVKPQEEKTETPAKQ